MMLGWEFQDLDPVSLQQLRLDLNDMWIGGNFLVVDNAKQLPRIILRIMITPNRASREENHLDVAWIGALELQGKIRLAGLVFHADKAEVNKIMKEIECRYTEEAGSLFLQSICSKWGWRRCWPTQVNGIGADEAEVLQPHLPTWRQGFRSSNRHLESLQSSN